MENNLLLREAMMQQIQQQVSEKCHGVLRVHLIADREIKRTVEEMRPLVIVETVATSEEDKCKCGIELKFIPTLMLTLSFSSDDKFK